MISLNPSAPATILDPSMPTQTGTRINTSVLAQPGTGLGPSIPVPECPRRHSGSVDESPDDCPEAVAQLVEQCTASDPLLRPTAIDVAQTLKSLASESM
eukprot:jgi/Botrbrau1/23618/Bobra.55_2s0011.3